MLLRKQGCSLSKWLLVIAAGLTRSNNEITVDRATARVCDAAATLWERNPGAYICAPASWSAKYRVYMGHGPMRTYLQKVGRIPASCLITRENRDVSCTTNGEMRAFAKALLHLGDHRPHIHLVVRHWHAPRALRLLNARLKERSIVPESLTLVPVKSFAPFEHYVREPLAWLKNLPNLRVQPDSS